MIDNPNLSRQLARDDAEAAREAATSEWSAEIDRIIEFQAAIRALCDEFARTLESGHKREAGHIADALSNEFYPCAEYCKGKIDNWEPPGREYEKE